VQKKQSRTTEELQKEIENEMGDDEPESESDEEDGEKPVYNPKKVRLQPQKGAALCNRCAVRVRCMRSWCALRALCVLFPAALGR